MYLAGPGVHLRRVPFQNVQANMKEFFHWGKSCSKSSFFSLILFYLTRYGTTMLELPRNLPYLPADKRLVTISQHRLSQLGRKSRQNKRNDAFHLPIVSIIQNWLFSIINRFLCNKLFGLLRNRKRISMAKASFLSFLDGLNIHHVTRKDVLQLDCSSYPLYGQVLSSRPCLLLLGSSTEHSPLRRKI